MASPRKLKKPAKSLSLRCAEKAPPDFPDIANDDDEWAARSNLWASRNSRIIRNSSKRGYPRQPLILAGHGVSMRIENGSLLIRNGFTHYPQKQDVFRFF